MCNGDGNMINKERDCNLMLRRVLFPVVGFDSRPKAQRYVVALLQPLGQNQRAQRQQSVQMPKREEHQNRYA